MFVKPAQPPDAAKPLRVRLCHAPSRHLAPEGAEVPETQDWYRALLRGDVVLPQAPVAAAAAAAEPIAHASGAPA